ncbi:MAG TPA: amino acid adenylation domain-containing protein [Candidatus Kapabacteria bacterium]|nr:amino acid adenylation domain-containing protein [Candidatus Kapabacteria bacterium]
MEEKIAGIWAEVLGVKKDIIGIDTNFFALGGHSLNATVLIARIHKELNVKFPLAEFFKIPTIKGLSGYILAAEKETFASIEPVEKKEYYKLSSAQKRLYALQQMEENNIAYNMSQVFPLGNNVDKEKLMAVFNRLLVRHETLRTSFEMVEGEPIQKIHENVDWELQLYKIDNTGWDNVEQHFKRPFYLNEAPLLRVGLVEIISPFSYYYLRVEMHHIISDEVSQNILQEEFMELYQGRELPSLRLKYKDYSEWQYSKQQRLIIKEQEKFWLEIFADEVPVLNLLTDFPRPIMQSFEGSTVEFLLTVKEGHILKELVNQTGVTIYMCILSVCTILLSRLSGQEDVVIGTPIAARRHADLEKIIGMFVNTLVMRNNPCGEKSYREFLLELKERTLKAYENQEYPFDELAEKILAQRDTSRNPVFDVMFDLVRPEENNPAISIIEEEDQHLYIHKKGISKFDLTFTAVEQGDRFLFNIEYCTRLFKSETINRFISHFKRILEFLSEDFDQKLSKLEIISVEEKQRILYEFNDTMIDYPRNKSIPQLFEEITTRMPDNIAVIGPTLKTLCSAAFEANQTPLHISYGELNKQSVRLAGLLIGKGVLPEIIVGIMIERSVEMIIGIMGILKAGGAYLPIDPEYPGERINYMLKDSGTKLLVTTNDKEGEKLRSWEGEKLLLECIIYDSNHLNGRPRGLQHSAFSIQHSNHLCYIIYTSGSTGKSKGVMVQHNHLVHAAFAWRKEYKLLEIEVILLQMANFCFDVFAGDLVRVLINGGKMIINPEKGASPHTIYRLISNHGVTLFESTPPYIIPFMNYIYENKLERGLASLQLLILGSDSCATRDFKELLSRFGTRMRIVNSYGVTEATIDSSYYEVASEEVIPAVDTVPIGRPLPNVKFYILDRAGMLLPLGVPGELCIGGAGVTRGYLNKPELSASKFGPQITLITQMSQMKYKNNDLRANFHHSAFDPHIQHSILYRTGDLARWLPCGNVEFLGRMDYQVKIRGFRIELGEIENQLLQHWDIKEAVVMCRGEMENDKYICAYIVTRKETSVSGLREYLVRYLPAYMTPSYFVNLEKIPLNANGKIDHKALPDPKKNSLEDDMECFLPQNEVEKILVDIWAKILGREKVGINQNFFAIGGDSIKSIQIISRMSRAGYKMEMKDLFQYPVISKLAPHIKKLKRIPDQSVITGKIPLTPIQKAFFNESHPCPHHYNQAVMLYSSEGFDKNALKNVFTNIQEHHDVLRMTYNNGAESGGEAIQFNHGSGYPLYLEEHDLRNCENCRRELKRKADAIQESIDLEKGPLMKLGLFHLDDGDRLLIAAHHLIIDGVSWRILFEDIETLYSQYKRGEKLVLPHKTDSFKLWSEKLSDYANSKILLKEKKYWQKIESIEVSLIPKDFAVDDNYIKDLGSVSFTLTEQETEILLTKVNEPFNTEINDIFLMALGMGIKKTFEQERVLIALEGHGREEILEDLDISRTVGWFTNVYPVVLDISYADHPGCQIKEIKETLRRIPNKGIGYGILRYLTHIENKKEITFKLKPQICFNYLGQFDADIKQKSSFELAKESAGNSLGLNNRQEYLLDVSGIIANNRLTMTIVYNKTHFKPETMAKLIGSFESELSNINAFCSTRKSVEKTPSDFTYKELSIDLLQQLLDVYPNVEDIYTLSPMQEGMLFHALMDQSSNSYFEQTAFRLHSELDIFLVEKSFNEVVNRHDILRTAFIHKDTPRAVQVVLKSRALDFYYQDISQIGGQGEKEFFLTGYKEKDKQRSFDLSKDVLMRIAVFRLSPVEYQFIWSHHHILMDGWCIGILNTEFFEIYTSYLENRPHRLKEVKPYRNYIKWLEKQDKEESIRYWENYLDSYEEQAGIPRTKTRKITTEEDQTGYRNETVSIVSNMEKTAGLNKLAAVNNVTLNIVTQTLWGILLGKYNGKEDVLFGGVVSGRPPGLEGIESMLGLFINTIPVRIRFESGMKLNTLLREIQEEALASEPHHYHPLAEIQSRSILRQNLIDHLFIFENYPIKEQLEISESGKKQNRSLSFKLTDVSVFEQTNYDFNVVLGGSDQLKISFQYNGNVYDEYSVERIAKYFSLLIDQVIGNQELEIRELTFLSEEEKEWVLYEFNNTAADYPKDKTIHQLFVEQAAKTPNHIALVGVTAVETTGYQYQITYRQLNNLSDYLAGILSEKGVLPDNIVGIIIERSVDMIIGILGILKSGGAYMPIDPEYPQERIEYMLKDSGTKLLAVANDQESEKVRRWEGEKILLESIIYDSNHLNGCPCQGLQNPALSIQHSNHLCYIIYTSGSTGNPKGVLIEHHSLVNRLNWMQKAYPIDERDTILQKTTFTFDVSVWEIFWWSMVGARLFLLSPGGEKDPGLITQTIERNNITTMHFVPSMLSAFLDYLQQAGERGQAKKLVTLKQVIASGEALLPTQVELFIYLSTKTNGTLLANLYGPTEATIDVSYFNCLPGEREIIPIGKPIDNINLYILDRSFHLQPIGIPGELCIGGVGLARGYLNRSDLTAEKFRPLMPQIKSKNSALQADFHHSASDIPRIQHSILYCTGDLARWLPDGNMEFLGRIDQQVKIRGFRVELGEIENRLLKVREIKEAVVVAQETGRDDKYLCAYFVSDRAYEISELHEILAKELPDYMLPSYFVRVENIPLTANGKVDRRALPLPEAGGMGNMGSEYIPPANEIEEKLTHIWSELLGIEKEKICTLHNFFEIGGTSLNLIRQISLIYKEFGYEISVNLIYRNPTIREIAKCIQSKKYVEEPVVLLNQPGQKRLFFFPPGVGFGVSYQALANILNDYSIYSFNFIENENRLHEYVEIITTIQKTGPHILVGYSAAGKLIFKVVEAMETRGFEVSDIILCDCFWDKNVIKEGIDEAKVLEDGLNRFIIEIEKYMDHSGIGYLKEKVRKRAKMYLEYLQNLNKFEGIHSNVHLIISEQMWDDETSDRNCWDELTDKPVMIYNGFGSHIRMFSEEPLEKNAELIKKILDRIESERQMLMRADI